MRRTINEPKTIIKKQTNKPISERQAKHIVKMHKALQKFLSARDWQSMKTKPKRDNRGKFVKRVQAW